MKATLSLLLIYSLSILTSCASFPDSSRELELRSEYGKPNLVGSKYELPKRKKQRVEKVFMAGRMLSSGDWFAGGRLLLVVNESDWIFEDVNLKRIEGQ